MTPSEVIQFDWADFLHRHRDAIIREWVKRLQTEISERYTQRPESELRQTIGGSFAANCRFLISGEKDELDRFIAQYLEPAARRGLSPGGCSESI